MPSQSNSAPILTAFGRRVRSIRKARGMTQQELAEVSGVDQSYIGLCERGQSAASITTIDKLSRALSVPPIDLFMFDAPSPAVDDSWELAVLAIESKVRYIMRPGGNDMGRRLLVATIAAITAEEATI